LYESAARGSTSFCLVMKKSLTERVAACRVLVEFMTVRWDVPAPG
jgi:hypothetical protein